MEIKIDDKTYLLSVREKFMDENKVFQEEIIPLDKWVEIVRKKAISSLYYIEQILTDLTGNEVRLDVDYPHIRKPILNLTGSIKRLPDNFIVKEVTDKK